MFLLHQLVTPASACCIHADALLYRWFAFESLRETQSQPSAVFDWGIWWDGKVAFRRCRKRIPEVFLPFKLLIAVQKSREATFYDTRL